MFKNTSLLSQMIPFSSLGLIPTSNHIMHQLEGTPREENATPYFIEQ